MATKKKVKPLNRWQRLLMAHRDRPWMSSFEQQVAIRSTTISKVRHECRVNGYRWISNERPDGITEYKPVRARV